MKKVHPTRWMDIIDTFGHRCYRHCTRNQNQKFEDKNQGFQDGIRKMHEPTPIENTNGNPNSLQIFPKCSIAGLCAKILLNSGTGNCTVARRCPQAAPRAKSRSASPNRSFSGTTTVKTTSSFSKLGNLRCCDSEVGSLDPSATPKIVLKRISSRSLRRKWRRVRGSSVTRVWSTWRFAVQVEEELRWNSRPTYVSSESVG
ncbi:hypothetical protein BDY19DRAFT_928022 [Irpex rosettiformis]|uniref:Uncharacterized protein n=1 Tax=Irpex rosettiformis TaxID=378272 RepID=A0ACB8UCG8_9APHY|nr:hypothetical protein BDY19DRAFT_928022 [Irpex rosettiformis]